MKILWLLIAVVTVSLVIAFYNISNQKAMSPVTSVAIEKSVAPPAGGAELGFVFVQPPRAVPELSFVDHDGQSLSLASFRGKLILLNIWATWCAPCRHEMPTLDRLQTMLGGSDFVVLPLSIDIDGLADVKTFYQELELTTLGVFVDETGTAGNDLNVVGVPTTLLLDRQGRELARKVGAAEWDSTEFVAFFRYYINNTTDAVSQSMLSGENTDVVKAKEER